jgi:hypothetical protein
MHATRSTSLAAAVVVVLAGACAPATGEGVSAFAARHVVANEGFVEIRNDGRQDVVLYLDRDGMRHRLGRVSRMETARFAIPNGDGRPSARLSLIARPVGSGRPFATPVLIWRPGQDVTARLGDNASYRFFDAVIRR